MIHLHKTSDPTEHDITDKTVINIDTIEPKEQSVTDEILVQEGQPA